MGGGAGLEGGDTAGRRDEVGLAVSVESVDAGDSELVNEVDWPAGMFNFIDVVDDIEGSGLKDEAEERSERVLPVRAAIEAADSSDPAEETVGDPLP